MATNEQEKPKSILEALGPRGEEMEPEMTMEESVAEALSSSGLVDRMESEQYPEMSPQEEILNPRKQSGINKIQSEENQTIIVNPPAMEKQITPASNIGPQPAAETSIPELQERPIQGIINDLNLRRLKDFVKGELYSVNWVRMHLIHVSRMPNALPSPTLWKVPDGVEVAKLVYDVVLSPGYVNNTWPTLEILLGPSIDNTEWCVGVLTTLAVFDAIRLLAYIPRK